ncbi:MAG: hypothetical protein RL223_2085 [Pseudomonadota bacterium]
MTPLQGPPGAGAATAANCSVSRLPAWADRPERQWPARRAGVLGRISEMPLMQRWGLSLATLALAAVGVALVLAQTGVARAEGASAPAAAPAATTRIGPDGRRGPQPLEARDEADGPQARDPYEPGPMPVRHHPGADGSLVPGLRMLGDPRLQQRLRLTAEQSARLHSLDDALQRDLDRLGRAQRTLHGQLGEALLQPVPDAAAVEALRVRLVAGMNVRSQRELRAWREAQAVLSADQRTRFADALREVRRHGGLDDEGAMRPAPWREGPGGASGGHRDPQG